MTARALTSPELALLRSSTQFSKLYLAVHKPNTIYTALLNGVPASNDQVYEITFDNGSGTLGNVTAGMTLYVGTSAGAYDLGMCRIRKAPIAGTFYIGLTSEIAWADNCYLTVVDDFDLWPKHATISDSVLSMDVDIAYSDQHENFNPVPIMGPHAVAWLDDATVDVDFDASDSWVFDSTISGYSWSAPGSSASSGMTSATPTVTYNAAGIYRVYCTVTAANGKTTTGVRHVFVYDRDANQPSTVFQLAQCNADYDSGGWMFDMEMQAEASLSDIRDRSLVVLHAEDWYGTTKQSIGPVENRENLVCVGRVVGESIRWDRETGRVHFTVQGAHFWLGKIKAFPVEMQFATNTPDNWSVMPEMTVDRVLWHILYWHSTAIETMDFYPTEDTRYLPEGKTLASSLWGQLLDISQSRLLASCGVDRFGRLFAQIDPQMIPEADRTWPVVMELTDDDWQEGIDLQRVTVQDVSLITLSSQLCDESGGVNTLYSLSPGHVPKRYGEPMSIDRLLAASQSESNTLAGLALGWHTNPYPEIPVVLAQNNRMIDLWPRQFCGLTVADTDTPREISFDGNLIPRRVSLYFDGDSGWMHPELNFEAETFEEINTDGDIPDVEDTSVPPFPHINFPDLPDLEPVFPGDTSSTPSGPPIVTHVLLAVGVIYTENFNADDPANNVKYKFWNTGLSTNDKTALGKDGITILFQTPNGAWYLGSYNDYTDTGLVGLYITSIYRAASLGAKWEKVLDADWVLANENALAAYPGFCGIGFNPLKPEEIAFIAGSILDNGTRHFWVGNPAQGFTQGASMSTATVYQGALTFGANSWVWDLHGSGFEYWVTVSADGSTIENTSSNFGSGIIGYHHRFGTSAHIIKKIQDSYTLEYSEDNGTSLNTVSTSPDLMGGEIACAPDGYMMGTLQLGSANKGRSSDYGATWGAIANLVPGGVYCWCWCGGAGVAGQWIAARGTIYFSADWGESWEERKGNLTYLLPGGFTILKTVVPGYTS